MADETQNYRADAVDIKDRVLVSMRQVIKELRHVDADNQREKKAKCTRLLHDAANNLTELFDLVLACDDERYSHKEAVDEREKEDATLDRLVQMTYDMDRGVRDPEEIFDYVKEHWDEP